MFASHAFNAASTAVNAAVKDVAHARVVFVTSAHVSPKRSAASVCAACASSIEPVTTTVVRELPPSAGRSNVVSLLSRYGTCLRPSVSAVMHLPNTLSDALMPIASAARSPDALDALSCSEPARSTRTSRERINKAPRRRCVRRKMSAVCARLDLSFIAVEATARRASPALRNESASPASRSVVSVAPNKV